MYPKMVWQTDQRNQMRNQMASEIHQPMEDWDDGQALQSDSVFVSGTSGALNFDQEFSSEMFGGTGAARLSPMEFDKLALSTPYDLNMEQTNLASHSNHGDMMTTAKAVHSVQTNDSYKYSTTHGEQEWSHQHTVTDNIMFSKIETIEDSSMDTHKGNENQNNVWRSNDGGHNHVNDWNDRNNSMGSQNINFDDTSGSVMVSSNPSSSQPLNIDDIPVGGGGGGVFSNDKPKKQTEKTIPRNRPSNAPTTTGGKPKFAFVKRGSRKEPTAMNRLIKEGRLPGEGSSKLKPSSKEKPMENPAALLPSGKIQPFARSAARVKNTSKFEAAVSPPHADRPKKSGWDVEILVPPPPSKPLVNQAPSLTQASNRPTSNHPKSREEDGQPVIESAMDWDQGFDDLQSLLNAGQRETNDALQDFLLPHHDIDLSVADGGDAVEGDVDWNDTWRFEKAKRTTSHKDNETSQEASRVVERDEDSDCGFELSDSGNMHDHSTMGINGDFRTSKEFLDSQYSSTVNDEWGEGGLESFDSLPSKDKAADSQASKVSGTRQARELDEEEPSELVKRIFAGRNHNQSKMRDADSRKRGEADLDLVAQAVQEALKVERAQLEELKLAAKQEKRAATRARQQHESILAEARRERDNTSKSCASEKEATEKWAAEQRANLAREKKLLNRQAAGLVLQPPSKKERAEIEALKATIEQLKSEENRLKGRFKMHEQRLKQSTSTSQKRVKELEEQVLLLEKELVASRQEVELAKRRRPEPEHSSPPQRGLRKVPHQPTPPRSHRPASTTATDNTFYRDKVYQDYFEQDSNGGGGGDQMNETDDENQANEEPSLQKEVLEFDRVITSEQEMAYRANVVVGGEEDEASDYDPTRYNSRSGFGAEESPVPVGNSNRTHEGGVLPPSEPSFMAVPPPPDTITQQRPLGSTTQDIGGGGDEGGGPSGDKIERKFSDGRVVTWYSNGTHKEVGVNGEVVVRFANGDIKRTTVDKVVTYYYESAKTTHTTFPNGGELFEFPSGQTERHQLDGSKEISFPDGTMKVIRPDGMQISTFPDGVVLKEYPQGFRDIISVDGIITREDADGSSTVLR